MRQFINAFSRFQKWVWLYTVNPILVSIKVYGNSFDMIILPLLWLTYTTVTIKLRKCTRFQVHWVYMKCQNSLKLGLIIDLTPFVWDKLKLRDFASHFSSLLCTAVVKVATYNKYTNCSHGYFSSMLEHLSSKLIIYLVIDSMFLTSRERFPYPCTWSMLPILSWIWVVHLILFLCTCFFSVISWSLLCVY